MLAPKLDARREADVVRVAGPGGFPIPGHAQTGRTLRAAWNSLQCRDAEVSGALTLMLELTELASWPASALAQAQSLTAAFLVHASLAESFQS